VKQAVRIPVIGNGDIQTPEAAVPWWPNRLRRSDDRARRAGQPMDLPPDCAIYGHRQLRAAHGGRPLSHYSRLLPDAAGRAEATRTFPAPLGWANVRQDEAVCHLVHPRRGGRCKLRRPSISANRRRGASPVDAFFTAQLASGAEPVAVPKTPPRQTFLRICWSAIETKSGNAMLSADGILEPESTSAFAAGSIPGVFES